jgi:ribosomal protein S18 acetylase RimI-like enzyme
MNAAGTLRITQALDHERDWAASLMAGTEPWIALGRSVEDTQKIFRASDILLYIAHQADLPCGFLLIRMRGIANSPYIASLAVSEAMRGKGVGSELLRFAEDLLRPDSRHLFMCVSSFNTRAKALYERLGYAVVGEFKDYIIDGASEYLMYKRLR